MLDLINAAAVLRIYDPVVCPIYTYVARERLKQLHAMHHPRG